MGYYYNRRVRYPLNPAFLFVLEACSPVFSTIAIVLYGTFYSVMRKLHKKVASDYRLPFGEEHYRGFITNRKVQITQDFEDRNNEMMEDSFQIEPFLDIIEGTDLDLKISAIGKLAGIKTKDSITLLKIALNDDNYEVRYFANNSLSLMEKSLVGEIEAYNQNISRYPNDFQNHTLLGLAYLNMFYLGIIDKIIGGVFLEQALYNFLYSLQINPDQNYLYVKILEVYIHQQDFDRVLELTASILEKDLPVEETVKVLFYQAEAHFNLGNLELLRRDCEQIQKTSVRIPLMEEALQFWGGER